MLEVIGWPDQTFNEIPKQDNPAFDKSQEGVMICKDSNNPHRFVVLLIKTQKFEGRNMAERVLHLAMFWDYHLGVRFAEAFAGWPATLHESLISK